MTCCFGDTLILATHNEGKVEEMRALLASRGITVTSAADFGVEAPEETETTFVGNARLKAHHVASQTGLPALADDSGIEVEALGGAPGVFTADWAETPAGRDFVHAMTKTWDLLKATAGGPPYRARFCCTLVLAFPDGRDEVFEAHVDGDLVWPLRGQLGHGYDPMFVPEGQTRTFAEMSAADKNAISHRARAFEQFAAKCFT